MPPTMLRRSHKKSTRGCFECRRRHVKCDERRPVCSLCTVSDRTCTFPPDKTPNGQPNHSAHSSSPQNHGTHHPETLTPAATPESVTAKSERASPAPPPPHPTHSEESINMEHMDLIIHLMHDPEISVLSGVDKAHPRRISYALSLGLEYPYLLYQVLAFSARRLAVLRPAQSPTFLRRAMSLQTRAISLFTAHPTVVDKSNCAAVLLFASILGHHALADVLADYRQGHLADFTEGYARCVETHRGIYVVAKAAWPLLMQSELRPVLAWSSGFTSRRPRGTQCDGLKRLVLEGDAEALGLRGGEAEREALLDAVRRLQIGLEAVLWQTEEEGNRYQMIFLWMMLMPREVTHLLALQHPVAMLLMAYYSALLHLGRRAWQVGDVIGACLFEDIAKQLGPGWDSWLEFPRRVVRGEIVPQGAFTL